MPFGPLRFMHITNALLDHPLDEAGPLTGEFRHIVEEATLTAFEQVITEAIDRSVDFLLLVGGSFDRTDRSLRAQTALRNGFARLAERAICVFVLPGQADPSEIWRDIPNRPGNVTVFFGETDEPVAVLRDGKVLATIRAIPAEETASNGESEVPETVFPKTVYPETGRGPFTIGLLIPTEQPQRPGPTPDQAEARGHGQIALNGPRATDSPSLTNFTNHDGANLDFLALGGRWPRQTIPLPRGIAHHPGGLQGMNPKESGPHGGTLVEVDADGTIQCSFLPAASVRWMDFAIQVDAETGWDELVERMRHALGNGCTIAREKACLVHWTIDGSGPLWDSLQNEEFRSQLVRTMDRECEAAGFPPIAHTFRLFQNIEAAESFAPDNQPARDFFEALESGQPGSPDRLCQRLDEAAPLREPWAERIRALVPALDRDAIAAEARRLGVEWFGTDSEAGTAR